MLAQFNGVVKEIGAILSVLETRERVELLWGIASNGLRVVSERSLRPAEYAFMQGRDLLKVRAFGREFRLKQPDLGLVRELYGHGIYFPAPDFIPATGSRVIDLGANMGFFSLICAGLGAEVLAVEAQSGFVALARDNFNENGVQDRVRFVTALIGASTGVFASETSRRSASHWGDEPPTLSMDELIKMFPESPSDGCPDIHLLKMDIEGSEFALFDGDLGWLRRISHISMEVHPEFGDASQLKTCIEKQGFVCRLVPSWREEGVPNRFPGYLFATQKIPRAVPDSMC